MTRAKTGSTRIINPQKRYRVMVAIRSSWTSKDVLNTPKIRKRINHRIRLTAQKNSAGFKDEAQHG
jgi:hypothetical protein